MSVAVHEGGRDRVLELGAVAALCVVASTRSSASDLVAVMAVAAVTPALIRIDLVSRRLPNPLVGLAAAGLAVSTAMQAVEEGVGSALEPWAWAAGWSLATFVMAIAGALGMGDVKLGAVLVAALTGVTGGAGAGAGAGAEAGVNGGGESAAAVESVVLFLSIAGLLGLAAVANRTLLSRERRRSRAIGSDAGAGPAAPFQASIVASPNLTPRAGIPFGPCLLVAFWTTIVVLGEG